VNNVIAAGFDYDPADMSRNGRPAAYTGAAASRATLADLLAGREIFRGEKPGGKGRAGRDDQLVLAIKLGMLPQFVTPGSFYGTITLTVSEVQ
jgi:hypothetical protein